MITQSHPSPEFTPVTGASTAFSTSPPTATPPEQKAQAKAQKKERKHARLRFFLGWCEGCQFFGAGF